MSPGGEEAGRAAAALTWALLGGTAGALLAPSAARAARASISRRGLALAGAAGCGAAAALSPDGGPTAANAGLALALAWLGVVDAASLRLPDAGTLPLAAAGLAWALLARDDPLGKAVGAAAGFLTLAGLAAAFRRATGRSGLGLGDAKLLAAGGAWLGWERLPAAVLIGCGLGFAALALAVARRGVAALRAPLAFGPALCVAILLARLCPAPR